MTRNRFAVRTTRGRTVRRFKIIGAARRFISGTDLIVCYLRPRRIDAARLQRRRFAEQYEDAQSIAAYLSRVPVAINYR